MSFSALLVTFFDEQPLLVPAHLVDYLALVDIHPRLTMGTEVRFLGGCQLPAQNVRYSTCARTSKNGFNPTRKRKDPNYLSQLLTKYKLFVEKCRLLSRETKSYMHHEFGANLARSGQAIAEERGGQAIFSAEDGVFNLKIMIPLENEAHIGSS